MPSDFNSAKWNMEHTDLMNKLVEELEERGCQIFIEKQNSFRVESARSGVVVGGTPDIIAVHPDGRTVTRQPFLPVASVVFAAFAPCLTVDFNLYGCDNL